MATEEAEIAIHYRDAFSLGSGLFIICVLCNCALALPALQFLLLWSYLVFDAIMFYTVIPFWISIEKSKDPSDKSSYFSVKARRIAIRVKVGLCIALIVMILRLNDFSDARNRTLLVIPLVIIGFEGFLSIAGFFREGGKNRVQNQIFEDLLTILSTRSPNFHWNAASLLIPSAISVPICITGIIALVGGVGDMLANKLFWTLLFMIYIEVIVEICQRFDCFKRTLSDPIPELSPERRYIANFVRVSVQGLLFYSMIVQISENPNYLNVNVERIVQMHGCGEECQERSRRMLMTVAALSGIQATVAFAIPFSSFLYKIFTRKTETKVNDPC